MRTVFFTLFTYFLFSAIVLLAQPSIYEIEPNDLPQNATEIEAEVVLVGTMEQEDQDAYRWVISDTDASKFWNFQLIGVPGRLTIVDFLRLEYSANGKDVIRKTKVFTLGSRDGLKPVQLNNVLLDSGEYILGFASAGGANSSYRPPIADLNFGEPNKAAGQERMSDADGYRFSITSKNKLHTSLQHIARDAKENALFFRSKDPVGDFFLEESGWFRFEVSESQNENLFTLTGFHSAGRKAELQLFDSQDKILVSEEIDPYGSVELRDLALKPGKYFANFQTEGGQSMRALAIQQVGTRVDGSESEPNDLIHQANQVDLIKGVSGRLSKAGEMDYFRFPVSKNLEDYTLELLLTSESDHSRQLCLLTSEMARVKCRTGGKEIRITDLVLSPGAWGVVVERSSTSVDYHLTLLKGSRITEGVESEPNDNPSLATVVPKNNRIEGVFNGDEPDYFELITAEEPQLWRFQLIGEKLHELAYYTGGDVLQQKYRAQPGQKRLRLDNLYLLPGRHLIRVSGHNGGKYTLLARPLGKPNPNAELEPNDDPSRMLPLLMGQTRTGVLQDVADRDNYRFTLYNYDHIELSFTPPTDGAVKANLHWDHTPFREFNAPEIGERVVRAGVFPPGDYRIELSAATVSEAEYSVSLKRLPRFSCVADCEPNDSIDFATPVPANGLLKGQAGTWRDDDWYKFPIFSKETAVSLELNARMDFDVFTSQLSRLEKQRDEGGDLWSIVIPGGEQTYLQISGWGNPIYEISVRYNGEQMNLFPSLTPPITMNLDLPSDTISAYRQYGQSVQGALVLENISEKNQTLTLTAASSDHRWQVYLSDKKIELAAGEKRSLDVDIFAPKDCWADLAVNFAVKAETCSGSSIETSDLIIPSRMATPSNPHRAFTLPDELLGGFNIAWSALGSAITSRKDSGLGTGFEELLDGLAVKQQGMQLRGGHTPEEGILTVKLASSKPVELAGVVLQLLGRGSAPHFLREFEVFVSNDGQRFEKVFEDQLLPVRGEQAFVFRERATAQYVRIHFLNAFSGQIADQVAVGEFKVIAKPGWDLSLGQGFNLASPKLGGHVVWSHPRFSGNGWDDLLLHGEEHYGRHVNPGQSVEWVVGFHHDRAARVDRIVVKRPEHSALEYDPDRILLSVSMDSPVGPWVPLADWNLDWRSNEAQISFENPAWARFVKFTLPPPEQRVFRNLPQTVEIYEMPTGDDYRSVLTEWGFASQEAFYESQKGIQLAEVLGNSKNITRDKALLLQPDNPVRGQVMLGQKKEWYRIQMPEGQNFLQVYLQGVPTVRTTVHAELEDGTQVLLERMPFASTSSQHVFEGYIPPGATLYLRVEEPPRNVVFLWDTSASIGAYLPVIYQSLMAYARDVVPGRDAANLMPFGGGLLLRDWYGDGYILQTILNDYPRKESSSEAEKTMSDASEQLSSRPGTKAIVMVTDAATGRYHDMWTTLREVQPRVFGIGVSSEGALGRVPAREQDLMQDWSRVNGGYYSHVLHEGEMEYAFDRAATMLRRPAGYQLYYSSENRPPAKPGLLSVVSDNQQSAVAGRSFGFILDASGSMLKRLEGKRRITLAKETLMSLLSNEIPKGTPVSLRIFGHREVNSCRTDLEIPLVPLDPPRAIRFLKQIKARNYAKTPIADSLAKVPDDMKQAKGAKTIVLITDGEETCGGDPAAVIEQLKEKGFDVNLNIVGFAINDHDLEKEFESWAKLGGGRYLPAQDGEALKQALQEALKVPYAVYDMSGEFALSGHIGDPPRKIKPGIYRVVVEGAPPKIFSQVRVKPEALTELKLEGGNS